MNIKFFQSLKFKIFILFVLFFTIFFAATLVYNYNKKQKELDEYLKVLNESTFSLISRYVVKDLYELNYTEVKFTLDSFSNDFFKNIYILTNDGLIFAQRNSSKLVFEKYKYFELISKNKLNDKYISSYGIKLIKKNIGYIIIENNNVLIQKKFISDFNELMILITFIFVLLLLFSYIFSSIIVNPIKQIILRIQKTINTSDELVLNYHKDDELGFLSKMIENNHNKIIKLNKNLHKKVIDVTTMNHTIKEQSNKLISQQVIIHQQSKMASMGQMIGHIAHQWRQPLSMISIQATTIKLKKENNILIDKELLEMCENINIQAQYLSNTIDDFRNFIKGDRLLESITVEELINKFLTLLSGSIENYNIKIVFDYDKNIKLNVYTNELIQCIINIFNNSKDAFILNNVKNRLFIISIQEHKNSIKMHFKDNAKGIENSILPDVFNPYFTTKHESKGTGLGLYMTYNFITEGMKGSIIAQNISFDYEDKSYNGMDFFITLPK